MSALFVTRDACSWMFTAEAYELLAVFTTKCGRSNMMCLIRKAEVGMRHCVYYLPAGQV